MAELNTAERSGRKPTRRRIAARVDLTAMVDLAFLLVTFFMLTTTFSKPKIMKVAMPVTDAPGEPVAASRTMTVCPGKNNKLVWYVGETEKPLLGPYVSNYGKDGIRKAIIQAKDYARKATGKHLIVIIKPAQSSVYGNLVNTLDELAITEVPTYAITDITGKDIDILKKEGIY